MESVVWEMEEAMGSALEVCLDSHIVVTHGCVALLGLHLFGVVLINCASGTRIGTSVGTTL